MHASTSVSAKSRTLSISASTKPTKKPPPARQSQVQTNPEQRLSLQQWLTGITDGTTRAAQAQCGGFAADEAQGHSPDHPYVEEIGEHDFEAPVEHARKTEVVPRAL